VSRVAPVSVVLAGVGGQGIVLASTIVARAAILAGFQVKTNEVHGMAQRGGSVIAQVRYGPEVHSPLVSEGTACVLASLEQIEALRNANYLAPEGLAVVSRQRALPATVSAGRAVYPADVEARLRRTFNRLIYLDAEGMAVRCGSVRVANVVVLGALSTGLDLPADTWHAAVSSCVPEKYRELNIRAFQAGREGATSAASS
jgi:indolepyruvate ferredoxin oxidoreductase beta subunit